MAITVTGAWFDAVSAALAAQAETDGRSGTEQHPDGTVSMSAETVLGFLRHNAAPTTHTIPGDDLFPDGSRKTRVVAVGEVVALGGEGRSEAYVRQVIQNAERLTGITAEYGDD